MLEWSRLDPARLERAVQMLVHDVCGATSIDGSGGDRAQDLRSEDADGLTIYEVKSFSRQLTTGQRRQITRSCLRAVKLHTPQRWVLIMPLNPSPSALEWFHRLGDQVPEVELRW